MSITTYSELQTAIANWTHRTDLTNQIPDFIRLAEDVIYADLDSRQQDAVQTYTTTAGVETVALTSNFIEFKSLSFSSSTPHGTIDYRTPDQYKQEFQYDDSGIPRVYTIIGSNMYLQPVPDDVYTLIGIEEDRVTSLSNSNPTNFLLTNFPQVYLAASMVQALIFTKDDPGVWQKAYEKAMNGVVINDWANGATMQVKQDINITSNNR